MKAKYQAKKEKRKIENKFKSIRRTFAQNKAKQVFLQSRNIQRMQDEILDLSNIGEKPETIAKELNLPIESVIAVINGDIEFLIKSFGREKPKSAKA